MIQIGKREFLQHASQYLSKIEASGGELVITHHNQPRLKIVQLKKKSISDLRGLIELKSPKKDLHQKVFPPIDKWFY